MDFGPKVEFPLILERPGNPYKWVTLHNSDGTLTIPKLETGNLYLFSFKGESYELVYIDTDTTLFKFRTLPFTHWFTKPISPRSRISNHISPIVMDDGVEYLVGIHGKLKFISTESILRDSLPITDWFDERELFPL